MYHWALHQPRLPCTTEYCISHVFHVPLSTVSSSLQGTRLTSSLCKCEHILRGITERWRVKVLGSDHCFSRSLFWDLNTEKTVSLHASWKLLVIPAQQIPQPHNCRHHSTQFSTKCCSTALGQRQSKGKARKIHQTQMEKIHSSLIKH